MRDQKTKYDFFISRNEDVINAASHARIFAESCGFKKIAAMEIAVAVTELSTNIVKYAEQGYITIALLIEPKRTGIEIVAEDRGQGIADIAAAFTDYVSTGKTLGMGLPAVKRLMDEVQIDSIPGSGTKIIARKWRPNHAAL
ncbi:MAG: anti-sigma regulatory factor [Gammaproteobacteria bacterium]|nr:anti-sigma regulatory factor [Gammaproteobacteria bacterium]